MQTLKKFKKTIWDYYQENKRPFAWRDINNPYYIVVSEIMLQQTQTYRVEPKFDSFIQQFPDFDTLARAPLRAVLAAWQGLGYNRRAIALQKISQRVMQEFDGQLPDDPETLVTFPGIGPNTAGSICAFAFNKPIVFIETNIRTVFLHFFFKNIEAVHDKDLMPLIAKTIDKVNARQWYYALMDYGVMLKKLHPNPSRKSKHHAKQSKFEGSDRQIRGAIVRLVTLQGAATFDELKEAIRREEGRLARVVQDLCAEGFLVDHNDTFQIKEHE